MSPLPVVPDYVGYTYAALVIAGGVAGYISKKSTMSLVMGLLFGIMIAVGAYLVSHDPSDAFVSTGANGVLTSVMGLRFFRSGKFMPAGILSLASLAMMLCYGSRMFV